MKNNSILRKSVLALLCLEMTFTGGVIFDELVASQFNSPVFPQGEYKALGPGIYPSIDNTRVVGDTLRLSDINGDAALENVVSSVEP